MLLKKKNIVVNISDSNKTEIERHIKELGYNEYNKNNVIKPRKKEICYNLNKG